MARKPTDWVSNEEVEKNVRALEEEIDKAIDQSDRSPALPFRMHLDEEWTRVAEFPRVLAGLYERYTKAGWAELKFSYGNLELHPPPPEPFSEESSAKSTATQPSEPAASAS